MKKTLSMLLAGAMLAAALTGCGSSASTGSDNADSSTDSSADRRSLQARRHRPADRRSRYLRQRLQERRTDRG